MASAQTQKGIQHDFDKMGMQTMRAVAGRSAQKSSMADVDEFALERCDSTEARKFNTDLCQPCKKSPELPHAGLRSIVKDLFSSSLMANVDDEVLVQMVAKAQVKKYPPGSCVVAAGSVGDCMYLVRKGKLAVTINGDFRGAINRGNVFGEAHLAMARLIKDSETSKLLGDMRVDDLVVSAMDVVCQEETVLLEWNLDALSSLIEKPPRLSYNLQRITLQHLKGMAAGGHSKGQTLTKIISEMHPLIATGLLKGVERENMLKALSALSSSPKLFPAGKQVVWRGDVGDTLFVVVSGLLSCRVNGKEVLQFGPGQFFGEVSLCARLTRSSSSGGAHRGDGGCEVSKALANCAARTADVVCLEESVLIELSAATMEAVCGVAPVVRKNLLDAARRRLLQAAEHGSTEAGEAPRLIEQREEALRARGRTLAVRETFDPSTYKTGHHRRFFNSSFSGSFSAAASFKGPLPCTVDEDSEGETAASQGGAGLPARQRAIAPKFSQLAARSGAAGSGRPLDESDEEGE